MDPSFPPLSEPSSDDAFEQIWQLRDDIVRRVWGAFDAVYVRRDAETASGAYVYLSEIAPQAQAVPASRWTYVTGGLSLPWTEDLSGVNPADYSATADEVTADQLAAAAVFGIDLSGYGFELVLHTPTEAPLAVDVLHNLGTYVLTSGDAFGTGHRVPLEGPIVAGSDTAIRVLLFARPLDRGSVFKLPSGFAQWLVAIGFTQDEWEFAQREGSAALLAALRAAGVGDTTDPTRASIFA